MEKFLGRGAQPPLCPLPRPFPVSKESVKGMRPRAREVASPPLQLCTKFEVRRPSNSADMTHFRNQHLVGLVTLTFNL